MLDTQTAAPQVEAQVPIDDYAPQAMDLSQAAAALSAFEEKPRTPSGQFQAKAPAEVVDIKTAKPVDVEAKKPESAKVEEPAAEDDEFFEWAPEKEGEAPKRVKADDVFAAYDELPKVKAALEEIRKTGAVPPTQVVEVVQATMQERAKIIEDLERVHRLINPVQPNPQSYADDPEGYRLAMERFQSQTNYIGQVEADWKEHTAKQAASQKILQRASEAEAEKAIYGFWPEMKDQSARNKEFGDIQNTLGIDPRELLANPNPQVWQVVKYALAYKRGEAKQAEAVKVVRAKPKLVRGSARQPTTTKADQVSTSLSRLSQTGSVDDAAAALGRLFG